MIKLGQTMDLKKHPHPSVNCVADIVRDFTNVDIVIAGMFKVMYENRGGSLTAPQIGIDYQIVVMHIKTLRLHIINPLITRSWAGGIKSKEGSLSFPGLEIHRLRWKRVEVRGFNAQGKPVKYKLKGVPAFAMQHSLEQLNGGFESNE